MKVIDKTPLQNDKGEIGPFDRLRGTLENGFGWYAELQAQKAVVAQLERVLEKGFTLVRNVTLGKSQITEPLVLIGPPGVYVIYVTTLSGFYEAKADQWNQVKSGAAFPAANNPMTRVTRLARALQVYLDKQGINLPGPVEPILMASSPALHIETTRPMVRVVLSDAIRQFGASLLQARPILKPDVILLIVERMLTPRTKADASEPAPGLEELPPGYVPTIDESAPSRARAIFHAAEDNKPFDPADLNFEFDENAKSGLPEGALETSPSQQLGSRPKGALSPRQWLLLGVMLLVECCVLAGFAYLIFTGTR